MFPALSLSTLSSHVRFSLPLIPLSSKHSDVVTFHYGFEHSVGVKPPSCSLFLGAWEVMGLKMANSPNIWGNRGGGWRRSIRRDLRLSIKIGKCFSKFHHVTISIT